MNIMKLKPQSPYLARAPSKTQGGAHAMAQKRPELLQPIYERNFIQVFLNLTEILIFI